jgi:hypothetical protein
MPFNLTQNVDVERAPMEPSANSRTGEGKRPHAH